MTSCSIFQPERAVSVDELFETFFTYETFFTLKQAKMQGMMILTLILLDVFGTLLIPLHYVSHSAKNCMGHTNL